MRVQYKRRIKQKHETKETLKNEVTVAIHRKRLINYHRFIQSFKKYTSFIFESLLPPQNFVSSEILQDQAHNELSPKIKEQQSKSDCMFEKAYKMLQAKQESLC